MTDSDTYDTTSVSDHMDTTDDTMQCAVGLEGSMHGMNLREVKLRDRLFDCIQQPLTRLISDMKRSMERKSKGDSGKTSYLEFLRHYEDDQAHGAKFIMKMATFHRKFFKRPMIQPCRGDFEVEDHEDTCGRSALYATAEQLEDTYATNRMPDVAYLVIPGGEQSLYQEQSRELLGFLRRNADKGHVEYQK